MKVKFLGTAAGLLAAVLLFRLPVQAASARSAILMDEVGSRVLAEKDPDRKSLIASTTKIMTGLLVCENCNVLEQVRIPREAVGIEGSSLYLKEGEVLTVQELLYGMMLRSGNDAATALAIHCGKTVDNFAAMMNRRAESLGMTGSHFENPHGLDGKNHVSTARDLGILGLAAMKNPIFCQTVSTKQVRIGERYLKNHNKLLWQYPGCDGVKTGYTKAAGRILVSSAINRGRRLVAVTIGDPDDWQDHKNLLDSGFAGLTEKLLIRKGQKLGLLEVAGGERPWVSIRASENFSFPVREGERAMTILPGPGFVYAPAVRSAPAGTAFVVIGGKTVGRIGVHFGETCEQAP